MTSTWAEFLQGFGSPVIDKIMYIVTNISSELFYGAALAFIYWIWDKHKGYRLGMVFLSSMFVNNYLKFVFAIPRPTAQNNVKVLYPETGHGFSFPSGHTQGATTFWGWLGYEVGQKEFHILTGVIIVMVATSRIYLNVHWPVDIIAGFLIAWLWIILWKLVFHRYNAIKWPNKLRLIFMILTPLLMYLIHPSDESAMLTGLLIGLPAGRYLDEQYLMWNEKPKLKIYRVRNLIGALGFIPLRYGIKILLNIIPFKLVAFNVLQYALIALWISYGAPLVFVRFGWDTSVAET